MKKRFAMLIVSALLILSVSGCGEVDKTTYSAPEVAVSSGLPEWSTSTAEKRISTETDTAQSTTCGCPATHTTTCRCPLTLRITTKTSLGSTNANCTYPTALFTIRATVREQDETFTEDFRGQVITTKAQMDALALDEEYGTDEYTESYFEDKALVVLEFRLTSGSIQLRVDTVEVNESTMTVFYTTVCPSPSTNDMAYRRVLLEISQKTADGIEHIVGERVPIQLPSGSPPNPTAL